MGKTAKEQSLELATNVIGFWGGVTPEPGDNEKLSKAIIDFAISWSNDYYKLGIPPGGGKVMVLPQYSSINAVTDICEPWINLWEGDEWGDSMQNLLGACHTSYGFSDEDCALFASKLIENLIVMHDFWIDDGYDLWGYGWDGEEGPKALAKTRTEACEARDYWLAGGNLGAWGNSAATAKKTIDTMPDWLFHDPS